MMVKFKSLADGGFVAGDTVTRRTCYAYPGSPNAAFAIRNPAQAAKAMMKQENVFEGIPREDYDARNWARIGPAVKTVDSR